MPTHHHHTAENSGGVIPADVVPDLVTLQKQREDAALQEGKSVYRRKESRLAQAGNAGDTEWGRSLLFKIVADFKSAFDAKREEVLSKSGQRHVAITHLIDMPAEHVALATCRSIIDFAFRSNTERDRHGGIVGICEYIANSIQAEKQAKEFSNEKKALYETIVRGIARDEDILTTSRRAELLSRAASKYRVKVTSWTKKDRLAIGHALLEFFIESTGLVSVPKGVVAKNKTPKRVIISDALEEWVSKYHHKFELFHPLFQPMLHPPKPWTDVNDGGYLQKSPAMSGIVSRKNKAHEKLLRESPPLRVYEAVNRLQATDWRINNWLFEVVDKLNRLQISVKDTMAGGPDPVEPKPERGASPEEWNEWKKKTYPVRRANRKKKARRLQYIAITKVAEPLRSESRFYFPYRLDFRGRIYAIPSHLHPMGNDLAKGLLEFAVGKPLGDAGMRWLFIHAANCFGVDKVSFDERVEWVKSELPAILAIAEDPLSHLKWWTEDADSPWQFLAACREIANATKQGASYVSHLPVSVDGSNNGLQHFSAMLRDAECGSLVNLVPKDTPADIYESIAQAVREEVERDVERLPAEYSALEQRLESEPLTPDERSKLGEKIVKLRLDAELAVKWHAFKIGRKLCKGPVMIRPYGGTLAGVRDEVVDYLSELKNNPFHGQITPAATYLASVLWRTMQGKMPGPREAMKWLRDAAKALAAINKPITWTTPSGFTAQQAYWIPKVDTISSFLFGRRQTMKVRTGDTKKIKISKQIQSFSPNFVHSLDASALVLTINAAARRGVTYFACVHDSYGTHAADMPTLQHELRRAFVEMYQTDILGDLKDQLDQQILWPLDPPPKLMGLDVNLVLKSDYFFS